MICSVCCKGDCLGNAPTESGFCCFRNERIYGERFVTHDEVNAMVFEYIEMFYNRKRLHSTLSYRLANQYLKNWLNLQQYEKQVA